MFGVKSARGERRECERNGRAFLLEWLSVSAWRVAAEIDSFDEPPSAWAPGEGCITRGVYYPEVIYFL